MTDFEIFAAHWNRLWELHRDSAEWVRLEEVWLSESAEDLWAIYRMDRVEGRHGLRRVHPLPSPDDEDRSTQLEWQAYFDVWDILEPHDVADAVEHDGILWHGHTGEDLTINGKRIR